MTKVKLKILDMHCTACAMNIDFALEDLPGVKSAVTNYPKSECIIEFDDTKTSTLDLISQIKSTGYTAIKDTA